MVNRLTQAFLLASFLSGGVTHAQDPYLRPSLDDRQAMANDDGVLPQLNVAMTNANVVDVRSGDILSGVTVVVRDGKIVSVGNDDPARAVEIVDMRGRYITPGLFEGHFHGGSVGAAQRALVSGVTTAKGASVGG
ncbi:MAG: hypothetical protein OEM63_12370, partial [Gammaproteobacteria bacterium]|nr:hypothetical protein [Gammaproteobacteria bacterium]